MGSWHRIVRGKDQKCLQTSLAYSLANRAAAMWCCKGMPFTLRHNRTICWAKLVLWLVCRLRVLSKQAGVLRAYGTPISRSQGLSQVELLQTSQSISTTGNAKLSGTSTMSKGALHAAQFTPASHVALQQAARSCFQTCGHMVHVSAACPARITARNASNSHTTHPSHSDQTVVKQ
jgi:hypothetical protein